MSDVAEARSAYSNNTFSTPRSAARAKACGASDRGKRAAIRSSPRTRGGPSSSRPGSMQKFLDIPHSVQHAHDLNRLGGGIVDDQIGVDGPEFQGTVGKIFANMSRAWFVTEKLQRTADILQNPARDHRAGLPHQEDLYLL